MRYGKSTLCWCCQKAVADEQSSCRWSRILWPVEGWETERGKHGKDHIIVKTCPEYLPDECVAQAAEYAVEKEVIRQAKCGEFIYEWAVQSLLRSMRLLDYDTMTRDSYEFIINKYINNNNIHRREL